MLDLVCYYNQNLQKFIENINIKEKRNNNKKKKPFNNQQVYISITSIYKWDLRQINIKVVYLNANLDEKIYVSNYNW